MTEKQISIAEKIFKYFSRLNSTIITTDDYYDELLKDYSEKEIDSVINFLSKRELLNESNDITITLTELGADINNGVGIREYLLANSPTKNSNLSNIRNTTINTGNIHNNTVINSNNTINSNNKKWGVKLKLFLESIFKFFHD